VLIVDNELSAYALCVISPMTAAAIVIPMSSIANLPSGGNSLNASADTGLVGLNLDRVTRPEHGIDAQIFSYLRRTYCFAVFAGMSANQYHKIFKKDGGRPSYL